jgi:CRP/FNR family cyclic AMP-dependent transcriptional regulator
MDTLEPILARHPFFEGLAKPFLELLTGCASNARYDIGQYLFHEGEEAKQFFIIREGSVDINIYVPTRGPVTLYTHEQGDVVGWSWLFPPYRWHFNARAAERTRVIALDGVCLRKKCDEHPDLGYEFLKRFSYKVIHSLDETRLQLLDLYGMPAEPSHTSHRSKTSTI